MTSFSNNLKSLRLERHLSQKALASALGTTNSSVCDWERGRSQPDLDHLSKIADYFDVSCDYLIGRKEY
ncbi:MAG: helix-turn-helix transcriptional regulator [Clostridia bacterium]|nr:helix-turn-helix transcriptional regulator [Clostridia bacterium]